MGTRISDKNVTDLNSIISNLFSENSTGVVRRESMEADCRLNSTLSDVIGQKIQTKGLPLALRKRLLYEQAMLKQTA